MDNESGMEALLRALRIEQANTDEAAARKRDKANRRTRYTERVAEIRGDLREAFDPYHRKFLKEGHDSSIDDTATPVTLGDARGQNLVTWQFGALGEVFIPLAVVVFVVVPNDDATDGDVIVRFKRLGMEKDPESLALLNHPKIVPVIEEAAEIVLCALKEVDHIMAAIHPRVGTVDRLVVAEALGEASRLVGLYTAIALGADKALPIRRALQYGSAEIEKDVDAIIALLGAGSMTTESHPLSSQI